MNKSYNSAKVNPGSASTSWVYNICMRGLVRLVLELDLCKLSISLDYLLLE